MTLSRAERAILYNQFTIMGLLEGPTVDEFEKKKREKTLWALSAGFEAAYEDIFGGISDDGLDEEGCKEVTDILFMFAVLEKRWEDSEDKLGVTEKDVRFWGWDSTTERKQYDYANYLSAPDGEWASLGHRASVGDKEICPMAKYRRMLGAWRALQRPYEATMEDVKNILGR